MDNPHDFGSMFLLTCVIADRPIYGDLRAKTSNVLAGLDVTRLFEASPDQCRQYILFTSQITASSTDVNLMDKAWADYCRLAGHLAASESANGGASAFQEQLAPSLADAALRMPSSPEEAIAGLRTFVGRLAELTRNWPAFARYHGPALIQVLSRIPTDDFTDFSQFVAQLRSRQ